MSKYWYFTFAIIILLFLFVIFYYYNIVSYNYLLYTFIFTLFIYLFVIVLGTIKIRYNFYLNSFCKANTKEKIIAITFDDGPNSISTPILLDFLKKENIPATFFIIGCKINTNENLLIRMISDGHTIGNHSYSHSVFFDFYPINKLIKDIKKCSDKIELIVKTKINYFRPPYGVTNPTLKFALNRLMYCSIGWSIRSFDTRENKKNVFNRVTKKLHNGAIILFHDNSIENVNIAINIIKYCKNNGYIIVSLDNLIKLNKT